MLAAYSLKNFYLLMLLLLFVSVDYFALFKINTCLLFKVVVVV